MCNMYEINEKYEILYVKLATCLPVRLSDKCQIEMASVTTCTLNIECAFISRAGHSFIDNKDIKVINMAI